MVRSLADRTFQPSDELFQGPQLPPQRAEPRDARPQREVRPEGPRGAEEVATCSGYLDKLRLDGVKCQFSACLHHFKHRNYMIPTQTLRFFD